MVRLTGPTLAGQASGSLANTLTFSTSKGRAYLKMKASPKQTNTPAQLAIKAFLSGISHAWTDLPEYFQSLWKPQAAQLGISPANAFNRWNTKQLRSKLPPCSGWPPASMPCTATWAQPTATKLGKTIRIDWDCTSVTFLWFILITKRTGPGCEWNWNEVVALFHNTTTGPRTWIDRHPVDGINKYRFYLVSLYQYFSEMEYDLEINWP